MTNNTRTRVQWKRLRAKAGPGDTTADGRFEIHHTAYRGQNDRWCVRDTTRPNPLVPVHFDGRPGFERTKEGAFIDWDELIPGTFSTSEVAVAHIAHGLAVLEAHGGGAPPRLRAAITKAMEAVT